MKGKSGGEMKENNGKCDEKERTEYKMDENNGNNVDENNGKEIEPKYMEMKRKGKSGKVRKRINTRS